jgi:asparagine synthase (glutamine-hydrolysing)
MPGLTICLTSKTDDPTWSSRLTAAQQAMLHTPDYAACAVVSRPGFFLGHVKYAEYPARCFGASAAPPSPAPSVYFEGRIYNKDARQIESELLDIATKALHDPDQAADILKPWIIGSEGEYVVALADPARQLVLVFTDPFARLPLYYYASDSLLLIARECKFVQQLKPRPAFDKLGWAEILTFSHLLGRRTLFEDVHSAPGGMLLRCQVDGNRLRTNVSSLYTFNFDEKDGEGKSVRQYASELVDLWADRCRPWGACPDVTHNVISLSGGKDSRVVAAIMAREKVSCVAASYLDAYGVAKADIAAAEQLAAALGIPWQLFKVEAPTRDQMEFLVRIMDGINPVANAKMLPYLERIVAEWGRSAVYITGDGGDFIFPDLRLGSDVKSIDDVVRVFLGFNPAATPVAEAEAIMGLPPGAVEGELRNLLASYPETDVMQKAIHFRGYERGQNWVFSGEDRTRFFLWQSTPHYFFAIFRHCMLIPDHLKVRDALYCEFMRAVSPKWAAIREANLGLPLSSPLRPWKYRLKHLAMDLPLPLRESVRFLVKGPRQSYAVPGDLLESLRSRLDLPDALGGIMSPPAVYRRLEKVSRFEFENFWTLVLLEKLSRSPA